MERHDKKLLFALVKRYRHETIPHWVILLIDLVVLAAIITLTNHFQGHGEAWELVPFIQKALLIIIVTTASYIISGTHRSIIRHQGMHDIVRVLIGNGVPMVLFVLLDLIEIGKHHAAWPLMPTCREAIELYTMQALSMIVVRLLLQRIYNDYFKKRTPVIGTVIYGAGAAGIITYNALLQDPHNEYKVAAFIDEEAAKRHQTLNGIPVMRSRSVLNETFVKSRGVTLLIIAIPAIRVMYKQAITNRALGLGLRVKTVPNLNKWINGEITSSQIESIKIEDLLERESITLDRTHVENEVRDKVVMVTGAAGSIGSEMCRQLIQYGPKCLVMLDQAESPMYDLQFELRNSEPYKAWSDRTAYLIGDVRDRRRMEAVFEQYHPQIIYHAAAYKHVPFMEENAYEAVSVNVFGTKNIADLAVGYGAEKFVMISTDKAVNPTNVMGATKRLAEIYTQSRSADKTHFITTRFGNVLGSNGSVIPLFKKQLAAGGPLTLTHKEIIRYFMTIPEACSLVLEAGAMGKGGDIFVFDMGKPVRIYDLAKKMIQLSGMSNIEIKEIGLRPGEKLYEELLATKENTIPTYHRKIMHAQVRHYEAEEVDRTFEMLHAQLATMDGMKIVEAMKKIVPEYVSNNSIYCQLDGKGQRTQA